MSTTSGLRGTTSMEGLDRVTHQRPIEVIRNHCLSPMLNTRVAILMVIPTNRNEPFHHKHCPPHLLGDGPEPLQPVHQAESSSTTITFWNASGPGRILQFLDSSKSHIICICEAWLSEAPMALIRSWDDFHQFWVPAVRERQRRPGDLFFQGECGMFSDLYE